MHSIIERIVESEHTWLFLDYDGTLADFAPTPANIYPDRSLIKLIDSLARHPKLRIVVLSGRPLSQMQTLMPVAGIFLAGTYGIELQTPDDQTIYRMDYDAIRPLLESLKPRWEAMITGRNGFYLEDKGGSLALHARFASDDEADQVLAEARKSLEGIDQSMVRLLGGDKFLEIGPRLAHKGSTITFLLERFPWSDALLVYFGDDDKDVEAFKTVHASGGIAILVLHASSPSNSQADYFMTSPQEVRLCLGELEHALAIDEDKTRAKKV